MKSTFKLKQIVYREIERLKGLTGKAFNYVIGFDIEVDMSLRGGCAGRAGWKKTSWGSNKFYIRINAEMMSRHEDNFINDTIPHEFAHILVYAMYNTQGIRAKGHGYEWQNTMRKLGYVPTRCHSMEVKPARNIRKFAAECACREHRITAKRVNQIMGGSKIICLKCHTPVKIKIANKVETDSHIKMKLIEVKPILHTMLGVS